jgi:hypothetical protein
MTTEQTTRFAPSARERWYTGSGQPVPEPSIGEITATITDSLRKVFARDTLEQPDVKAALTEAATAVRSHFLNTTDNKDTD